MTEGDYIECRICGDTVRRHGLSGICFECQNEQEYSAPEI